MLSRVSSSWNVCESGKAVIATAGVSFKLSHAHLKQHLQRGPQEEPLSRPCGKRVPNQELRNPAAILDIVHTLLPGIPHQGHLRQDACASVSPPAQHTGLTDVFGSLDKETAWYCMRGDRPTSPSTTTATERSTISLFAATRASPRARRGASNVSAALLNCSRGTCLATIPRNAKAVILQEHDTPRVHLSYLLT